ncbi:hypothetical protein F4604DRAFT_1917703 [Suillus subluteus]|nr:hypothetical protein F4604DRAFT_1917703 [Suillus subluteus]
MATALKDAVFISIPETAICAKLRSNHSNVGNNIWPECKPHEAFDSDSIPVPVPVLNGGSAARPTTTNSQPSKKMKNLIAPDELNYLLDSFRQFVAGNREISPSGQRVCQKALCFIVNQDRHHEYEEFSGIRRAEYEELERFIDETCYFGLKPRLTYFNDDTLIIEMPSAVHEAPLVALHTALTCFLQGIPFDRQAINANAGGAKVITYGLAETAFSQHYDALAKKLQDAIIENPSLSLAIAIVIFENQPYRSSNSDSDTARSLLREPSKRAAEDFVSVAGHHPGLNIPVIVENHVWCSISSVWFKVWVRGDDPIDIFSNDSTLVADGFLYPQDTMTPALAMLEKGVNAIREKLVWLCKEIDDNVDVDALRDPTIVFRVRKEDIVAQIAGAMHETAYRRYSAWYDKALKVAKGDQSM